MGYGGTVVPGLGRFGDSAESTLAIECVQVSEGCGRFQDVQGPKVKDWSCGKCRQVSETCSRQGFEKAAPPKQLRAY